MAMLRRLHLLGSKSGSDPTAQLLRSLSSRTNPSRKYPEPDGDEPSAQATPGAIGPPLRTSQQVLVTGNRGLCGLEDAGRAGGGWHVPGLPKGIGLRSLTTAEPRNQRDEDSDDDSNLLNGIHAERTKALEMDASDEDDLEDVDELYSSLSFNGARVNNLENKRSWTQRPLSMPRDDNGDMDGSSELESDTMDLANFDINPRLQKHLRKAGVDKFFPVQAECFEKVVDGQDLMCKSRTGSGKTLAFAIPIVEALDRQSTAGEGVTRQRGGRGRAFSRGAYGRLPRAIVLAPTRELAKQVEREFNRVAPDLASLALYGGTAIGPQIHDLRNGVDVIVGTPGRIIDHIEQGNLRLNEIQFCVLDEADLMLQMGFQEPVEDIFKEMPDNKQTTLWSATMPRWVQQLAGKYLHSPDMIDMVGADDIKIPVTIQHWSFAAQRETRSEILGLIATMYGSDKRSMIFTQTKAEVDELCTNAALTRLGAEALHGGLSQAAREATLSRFRAGRTKVIVATDVAARGLDIPGVDIVLHYRLPSDQESFVHRSGRTGRAGKSGINIVLCSSIEEQQLAALEKEYSFASVRRATPSAGSFVREFAQDLKSRILGVKGAPLRMYRDEAADLLRSMGLYTPDQALTTGHDAKVIPEEGIAALSAAMALLGGAEAGVGGETFSMIDGRRGSQSVLVSAHQLSGQHAVHELVAYINENRYLYRKANEGALLDFPGNNLEKTLKVLEEQLHSHPNYEDAKVKLPEEVQGILETGGRGRLSNASGGRRGSRGGYGGGSYGGGGGGGGYQGRGEGMFQGGRGSGSYRGRGGYQGGGGGYQGSGQGGHYGGGGGRGQGRYWSSKVMDHTSATDAMERIET